MYVSVDLLLLGNKAFEPNLAGVGWCYSTTGTSLIIGGFGPVMRNFDCYEQTFVQIVADGMSSHGVRVMPF